MLYLNLDILNLLIDDIIYNILLFTDDCRSIKTSLTMTVKHKQYRKIEKQNIFLLIIMNSAIKSLDIIYKNFIDYKYILNSLKFNVLSKIRF